MLFPLVLCAVVLLGSGKAPDDEWIDPTDMLNYDAASGTMRRPYKANYHDSQDKNMDAVSTEILSSCSRELDSLQQKVADCEKRNAKSHQSRSFYIFKRYLNKILNEAGKLGLPKENVDHVHYDAEIILTKQAYMEILKFLSEETWQSGAVDDALSDILINFKPHNYEAWHWRFEDTFGIDLYNMFLLLLCLVCGVVVIATELWTRIHWFVQLKRLLLISFLISFAWNWLYLYKRAFAQHQADIAKMGQFDNVCAEKLDWRDSLFGKCLFHCFGMVCMVTAYSVPKDTRHFFRSTALNFLQQQMIWWFNSFFDVPQDCFFPRPWEGELITELLGARHGVLFLIT